MGRDIHGAHSIPNVGGCKPAARVLSIDRSDVNCDMCPFPFCVVTEAGIIKAELKESIARVMHNLGSSMQETASALEVSLRSVYRYTSAPAEMGCVQCNLTHSQDVMCKANAYSVAYRYEQYTIILNKHRHATALEQSLVENFTEYVFPSSRIDRKTDNHEYWVLESVEPEEARSFGHMCDALNKYTLSLGEGNKCLQQVK